jgi:hypothetical protein
MNGKVLFTLLAFLAVFAHGQSKELSSNIHTRIIYVSGHEQLHWNDYAITKDRNQYRVSLIEATDLPPKMEIRKGYISKAIYEKLLSQFQVATVDDTTRETPRGYSNPAVIVVATDSTKREMLIENFLAHSELPPWIEGILKSLNQVEKSLGRKQSMNSREAENYFWDTYLSLKHPSLQALALEFLSFISEAAFPEDTLNSPFCEVRVAAFKWLSKLSLQDVAFYKKELVNVGCPTRCFAIDKLMEHNIDVSSHLYDALINDPNQDNRRCILDVLSSIEKLPIEVRDVLEDIYAQTEKEYLIHKEIKLLLKKAD